jgi:hypothetical protein
MWQASHKQKHLIVLSNERNEPGMTPVSRTFMTADCGAGADHDFDFIGWVRFRRPSGTHRQKP